MYSMISGMYSDTFITMEGSLQPRLLRSLKNSFSYFSACFLMRHKLSQYTGNLQTTVSQVGLHEHTSRAYCQERHVRRVLRYFQSSLGLEEHLLVDMRRHRKQECKDVEGRT